jgi:hypothetical protein
MKKTIMLAVCLILMIVGQANATLTSLGNGMVYDDVRIQTWYDGEPMATTHNWDGAMAWAASLVVGGYDDWRLPTAFNADGSGPTGGFGPYGEMGYLFYTALGNSANPSPLKVGPFEHLSTYSYYTSTPSSAFWTDWAFDFMTGQQFDVVYGTGHFYPGLAVRDGGPTPNPTPEPATMLLFGIGFVGLAGVRRLRRLGGMKP